MTKRRQIVNSIVSLLNSKLNGRDYKSNIHGNAHAKLVFWDEVNDYPFISVNAGAESREYLPSNFKWGYLEVIFRIYVEDEDSAEVLEQFLADIESILDANNELQYDDSGNTTELISILSIDTDQGLFNPIGVGEMVIQVQYDL